MRKSGGRNDESEDKMKQSELLRKQADMMDMAEKHGIEWKKLIKIRIGRTDKYDTFDNYLEECIMDDVDCKFALGVVEGKPVFAGDTLYTCGVPYRFRDGDNVCDGFSWNLPKPKTILVELLVEDAEWAANNRSYFPYARISDSCSKALESIK